MKIKAILLTGLVIFFFSACEKNIEDPIPQEHFFKLYGSFHNDYILSVEDLPENGLLVAGYSSVEKYTLESDNAETSFWPYLCKILPSGMIDWDTLFGSNYENSFVHHALAVGNKTSILSVISHPVSHDSTQLFLQSLAFDGTMSSPASVYVDAAKILNARIVEQNDGGIRLVVQVERTISNTTKPYLLVYNLMGNDSLDKSLDMGFTNYPTGMIQVAYTSTDQIIVGTTVKENTAGKTNISLLAIGDKTTSWNKTIRSESASLSCNELRLINGEIVITGNQIENNINSVLTVTANPADGTETSRIAFAVEDWTLPVCTAFTINDNNNYVYTGYVPTGIERSDIIFVEATKDGKLVRTNTYGSNGKEAGKNAGRSIRYLGGDNYLLSGELEPITNLDICLFRLNTEGNWID
jgi:hypothetical protein